MANYTINRLRGGYNNQWHNMVISPNHAAALNSAADLIIKGKAIYQQLETETGVPWYFTGILHYRESSCNFHTHLHNGDSLNGRTYHVPAGRPRVGNPPFTFDYSAQDALRYEGYTNQPDWSLAAMAYRFEAYNGWGYRYHGVPSAYLWSYTNQYHAGKYVADGVFDAGVVDPQIGTMPLLKTLAEKENITLLSDPPAIVVTAPAPAPMPTAPQPTTVSPKADPPRPSSQQMNKTSRKYWWNSIAQIFTFLFGGSAATFKALDVSSLEQTKTTVEQIKSFIIDYGFWCGVAILLAYLMLLTYQQKLMKDDVQEGRATPSGEVNASPAA